MAIKHFLSKHKGNNQLPWGGNRGWQLDNSEKAIRGGNETNRKRQVGVAIRQIGKGN